MTLDLRSRAGRLPSGRRLPEAVWEGRHRGIVRLSAGCAAVLALLTWGQGSGQPAAAGVLAAVAAPLVVAVSRRFGRGVRAAATTCSLLVAAVALIHLSGGMPESHFAFFVVVGVVALYQAWIPFGIAVVVVAAHHGVLGALQPHAVFGHDSSGYPWLWAGIHAAFVLAASLAHLSSGWLHEEQVLSDPLTGLANQTLLVECADRLLARGGDVSVLFLDLDDFKAVNDSGGHDSGNALLLVIAERLRGCVRPGDVVARTGGDEFAVVVDGGVDVARAVGERALVAVSLPVPLDGGMVFVRASAGMATSTDTTACTAATLLRNADMAMYLAKAQGKNRLVGYADDMAEDARRRARLGQDLAVAAASGQLEVHYQPTVRLADGRTTGFEALARWNHPVRGLVPPCEFIPLAEETGDIVQVGRWVLREALRQGAAWTAETGRPLHMAVNLSPRQFHDGGVAAEVAAALAESGFPAEQLVLEITESVLVRDVDAVVAELSALRALGVRIAIDDFGTGFSGLSYLRHLPADILKIDRSFVSDLPDGCSSVTLITAMIELARTLGLAVVAEGVETEAQRRALADLACESAQGYLFAPPAPAEHAGVALRRRTVAIPAQPGPPSVERLGEVAAG